MDCMITKLALDSIRLMDTRYIATGSMNMSLFL